MNTNLPIDSIIHGDALEILKSIPSDSIHAVVTDPPCGINFMNMDFDSARGGRSTWVKWLSDIMKEVMRVMLPGAHGLIWSLPRQSHWTMLALEDAGFTIRDNIYNIVSGDTTLYNFVSSLNEEQQHAFIQIVDGQREPSGIMQIFGSGFPKSANVSKLIDKMQGIEREILGWEHPADKYDNSHRKAGPKFTRGILNGGKVGGTVLAPITEPATPESAAWDGWGSALKPAVENWILVRKPLVASNIAENVLKYGTGALNIDATRISHNEHCRAKKAQDTIDSLYQQSGRYEDTLELKPSGRFPSHLLLTHHPLCVQSDTKRARGDGHKTQNKIAAIKEDSYGFTSPHANDRHNDEDGMETVAAWQCHESCAVRIVDLQSGQSKSKVSVRGKAGNAKFNGKYHNGEVYTNTIDQTGGHNDQGGASRYFQQFPALDDVVPYIYAGKAPRKDRDTGLDDLPGKQGFDKNTSKLIAHINHSTGETTYNEYHPSSNKNTHPTVKNTALVK